MAFDSEQIGRAAYAAYGEVTGHKNFLGDPMPDFDGLGPTIQAAWRAGAAVAFRMGWLTGYSDARTEQLDESQEEPES